MGISAFLIQPQPQTPTGLTLVTQQAVRPRTGPSLAA